MRLLTLIGLFLLSFTLSAAQVAVVKKSKAIIYSDKKMVSPIGYVRKGKKLLVGDVKKRRGTILPVVVSGRVAYVKVEDIRLDSDLLPEQNRKRLREHVVADELDGGNSFKITGDRFLVLSYNQFGLGDQWEKLSSLSGQETLLSTARGANLFFEYRPNGFDMSGALGLGFYFLSNGELTFKMATVEGNVHYKLAQWKSIFFEVTGGGLFSGDLRIRTSELLDETKGSMVGYQVGVQAKYLPDRTLGFSAGANLRRLHVFNMEEVQVLQDPSSPETSDFVVEEFDSVTSLNFFLGASYKF